MDVSEAVPEDIDDVLDVLLPTFDTLRMERVWVLEDLFVVESARRLGLASALLRYVEQCARATGATRISLTTAHENFAAQALYVSHGYDHDLVFRAYHRVLEADDTKH